MGGLRCLSLFSGIGAHDLGLSWAGVKIAGQVEIDPFCAAVLERHWPGLPRWADVRTVTGDAVRERCGRIDLITGGFPCQDISVAGKGAGLAGARSGLFFEMARVIGEVRPRWVLLENVPALKARGYERVEAELEALGYALWPSVAGAWACGAPHKRDRVWIVGRLANALRTGSSPERERGDGVPGRSFTDAGDTSATELADAERASGARSSRQDVLRHEQRELQRRAEVPADAHGRPEPIGAVAQRVVQPGIPGRDGPADQQGAAGLVNSERKRGQVSAAGRLPSQPWAGSAGPSLRWPARPGEPQHEWEAPRLVANTNGDGRRGTALHLSQRESRCAVSDAAGPSAANPRRSPKGDGPTEPGVGGATAKATRRLAGFARRNALKALGNANPPYVPYLIGEWLMAQEGVA